MGFAAVEVHAGRLAGFRQDRLAIGEAGQGGGVEAGERVERIALEFGALNGSVEEAEIEAAVVANQNRALAAVGLQRLADATENISQGAFFTYCHAQRVIELDAGEIQCGLFDVGAGKRLNTKEIGVVGEHEALFVHADGGRGNFQQGVGGAVETAGFNIDDYRQVTAKALGHGVSCTAAAAAFMFVVVVVFAHAVCSSRRQRSCSPARSGITVCSPSGKLVGAVQSSRTKVMRSVLRGRP